MQFNADGTGGKGGALPFPASSPLALGGGGDATGEGGGGEETGEGGGGETTGEGGGGEDIGDGGGGGGELGGGGDGHNPQVFLQFALCSKKSVMNVVGVCESRHEFVVSKNPY